MTLCHRFRTCFSRLLQLACSLACAATGFAQDSVDYLRHVKPVLQSRCFACHGALKQEGGLRLDTAVSAIKGGESGTAIRAKDADGSLLVQRIGSADESTRMPPEGEPLKPAEIAALKAWISQGAIAPKDERPEMDPGDHWAFRAPVRPVVPARISEWGRNEIDAFIAAEHQKRSLTSQKASDKRLWLRRVSLDLIGLPPTREELEAFLADESAEAWDRVVTRLLDSPQYGERWGRHWMDIWRYSDWWGLGAEVRNSQKHIWHWRDWIIESLNADKGYDQMLREMLAADELYPNDLEKLRASGFLARQYFKFNRTSWLDETIEHTSKAMLGLTFNCAKCHDHKYDPLTQQEYYRLRAIFEPYQVRTDALPGEIDFEKGGLPRAFDCNLEAQTFIHLRGDDRNPDKSRVMEPGVPSFLKFDEWQVEPVALPAEAAQPGLRPFVEAEHLKQAQARIADATAALSASRKKLTEAVEADRIASAGIDRDAPADALTVIARQLIFDNFAAARPDVWEIRDGKWDYVEGRLNQSMVGLSRTALRLRQTPPSDFDARVKFVTTGGDMWKSVGITFDVAADNQETLAYVSSYAGGSKSQVAYKQQGNYVYPPEGAQSRPVELNQPHELRLRVRGNLINLSVDGQHSVAYRLPVPRQPGLLEIITFDARAEFLEFELKELPASVILVEHESSSAKPAAAALPLEQAQLAVQLAEKSLKAAEAVPESIQARFAADRARVQAAPDVTVKVAAAVRAERTAAAARADEEVCRAELELLRAATDKRADAEKKLTAARTAQDAATKALGQPGDSYTSIPGSLKTMESNLETEDSRRKPFPATSTGRRTAFARWVTSPRNPLTARVAVNHIWSRHFGRPLVPTVFDFGRKGTLPTHPELLDWLAVEFQSSGWSMKHLHRLMVTSATYRLASTSAGATEATLAGDPENRYYWRSNPIRMEAQVVRDSLLHLAGELDLTRGGPSLPIASDSRRRSLYFVHSHNEHQKFLSMFDDASVLECYRRAESIVPQQALALENSPLATAMAEKIERRITMTIPPSSETEFVRAAFLVLLSTEPTEAERTAVLESMQKWKDAASRKNRPDPAAFARVSLIHVLLNHNDFVTIR